MTPDASSLVRWLVPARALPGVWVILAARGLRALVDGYMSVLLPAYLLALGLGTLQVGVVATATLLGSALTTIAVGLWGQRIGVSRLLVAAAWLMVATGLGFAGLTAYWPLLLLVAFVGTLNPSAGDVSLFLPLEHAELAASAKGDARTALFARYSVIGAVCASLGALAAGLPQWLERFGWTQIAGMRAMLLAYAAVGVLVWALYRRPAPAAVTERTPYALGASRGIVVRLALLFSIDAFAGGFVVNALMSLWLMQRFGMTLAEAGVFFFWTGLLSAASQLAAPWVARRIGLLNTMVFTHIPSSICLIAAALAGDVRVALALLCIRAALSQMDVPTRSAYVMAVVTPAERPAAASLTAVPRSLAAALSPTLAAALFSGGWLAAPLVACGLLKIGYDVALWVACRRQTLETEP